MPTLTWVHGGSPLYTSIGSAPAGVSANGDLAASAATWNGTGNENGDTGTVAVTSEVSPGNIATVQVGVQLFDPGTFTPADTLNTLRFAFDWAITNGPMGTATAASSIDTFATPGFPSQTQGAGASTGTYDHTDTGANLGVPTIGDLMTAAGIGGPAAVALNCTFTYSAGTFSNHNRRLAISNLQVVAQFGSIPVVTNVSPSHGDLSGGTLVTLGGTGFTGATSVLFGSTPATSLHVQSDTALTCLAPAHATGTVTVSVA